MKTKEIVEGLVNCELFTSLSEEEIRGLTESLADACGVKAFKAGERMFEQGEYSTRLYVVAEGQVLLQRSINIGDRTAVRPLGLLGRGRATGWSSLLYGPRYLTASAVCQKPTQVISIEGASLRSVLEKRPAVGFKVMDRLAGMLGERLRAAYDSMEAHL